MLAILLLGPPQILRDGAPVELPRRRARALVFYLAAHQSPVSREQLVTLMEAGRWAPSCNGDEPWRYLVWDRSRDPDGWRKAYDCLSESNRKWVKNVPLLLLSCAGSVFAATGKPNRWTQHDTGAASVSMALQAVAQP